MPMPYYKNSSSAPILALLGITIICLMIFIAPDYLIPALSKIDRKTKLLEFEKDFEKIQHPEGSERVSIKSEYGSFTQNQKGCDFFVGEIRSFNGDKKTIQESYYDQKIENISLQVLFLVNDKFTNEIRNVIPAPLKEVSTWKLPKKEWISSMYLVYLVIEDYEGGLKLDC